MTPAVPASPDSYHQSHHLGPFDTCWRCGRARGICQRKIRFGSWAEAEEWVREFNESHRYTNPVGRYRCRWCLGWHMTTAGRTWVSAKRAEKQRRRWLRQETATPAPPDPNG